MQLVESGGADLPHQSEIFIPGGQMFRDITALSAAGIPTIAIVFGNSTAGGAYVPGMSDHVVMIDQRSKVFLGGPPLVKMATGEESDDESLGGADMHARISGLADYFATDEVDALRIGRQIVRRLNQRKRGPAHAAPAARRATTPTSCSASRRATCACRSTRATCSPASSTAASFDEFKPRYGASLVSGWAAIHGYPVGVLANNGVLFNEESKKAAQFIQLGNQTDTPLVFLQNITGFMVGKDYEQRGIIKDGSKMINAVTNSQVPHLTVMMGAATAPATTACAGRAYGPRSCSPGPTPRPRSWARSSSPA